MALRRYPPFRRTPEKVKALPSEGQVPTTVIRRRYPSFGRTQNREMTLRSLGTASVGGFQAAWATGSNVVLQVLG